jgi:protein tyrosine/serine phosphatase
MIRRLRRLTDGLYRGSAPSPKDLLWLKEILGIKKVISLDKETGDKIDRPCKMLGIDHVKAYIEGGDRKSLYHVLSQDLKHFLLDGGPTYFHCHEGKDRTGLIAALFRCKCQGWSPEQAIKEAKSLGFGVGIPPESMHLYEKIIRSCKPHKDADVNSADIVSNEREYIGDNRDTYLDESRQDSWATYLDHTRQNPMDAVYVYNNDQGPTRQNYNHYWEEPKQRTKILQFLQDHPKEEIAPILMKLLEDAPINLHEDDAIPQVGIYNNDAGQRGFGPIEEYSGFFYD